MNGWAMLLLGGGALVALLWRLGKRDRGGLYVIAAAVALAAAGYAWQGRPTLAAAPVTARAEKPDPPVDVAMRGKLMGRAGAEAERMAYADAYYSAGRPDIAARVLQLGLKDNRNSPQLWVALATAIMAESGGQLVPAAEHAFHEAHRSAPDYPATYFFHGLALAENGRRAEARAQWLELLRRVPPDRAERALVAEQLMASGIISAQDVADTAKAF